MVYIISDGKQVKTPHPPPPLPHPQQVFLPLIDMLSPIVRGFINPRGAPGLHVIGDGVLASMHICTAAVHELIVPFRIFSCQF